MLIRRYEPRDFADCDWLQRSHYLRPASQEELRGKLEHPSLKHGDSTYASWVALDQSWSGGSEIVGNIITCPHLYGTLIWSIVVATPYRNTGIGGQLMDAAEKHCGGTIYLYVEPINRAAQFYKKRGYKDVEFISDFYGPNQPAMLMVKNCR